MERIAAEVDIPLEDVRRAMEELGYAEPPAVRAAEPPPLPPPPAAVAPATFDVDRVGDGEIPAAAFAELEAELADVLGPGHATHFDGQLTWRTDDAPDTAARSVEVTITPRGGKTRVRLAEWRWRVKGRVVGGAVGALAGASLGSITGWLVSAGNPMVAQLLMLAGAVAGALVFSRAVGITDTENETARLNALADRLIGRASRIAPPGRGPAGAAPRLPKP